MGSPLTGAPQRALRQTARRDRFNMSAAAGVSNAAGSVSGAAGSEGSARRATTSSSSRS